MGVAAVTGGGQGVFSPTQDATTEEAAPSGPPQNILFPMIGSRNMTMMWQSPEKDLQNGVIIGYHIMYRPLASSSHFITISIRNVLPVLSTPLPNLRPFTTYSVSVLAFTKAGNGTAALVQQRTLEDVPGPPYIDRIDPLGTTSFSVSWLPPDRPNGLLTGYIITVTNSTQHILTGSNYMVLSIHVDARETYHVVNMLTPNTNYSISMKARTSQGAGEDTGTKYVTTNKEKLGAPQALTAHANGPASIWVTWQPPTSSFSLTNVNYSVTYFKVTDGSDMRSFVGKQHTSNMSLLIADGLVPYSYYEIQVSVIGGSLNSSATTYVLTDEDEPGQVRVFDIVDVLVSSVRLQWAPPDEQNGRIGYGYYVRNVAMGLPPVSVMLSLPDLDLIRGQYRYDVLLLEGDTEYEFSVFAFNIKLNSSGDASHTKTVRTKTGIPGPPRNVVVQASERASILVFWLPPALANGLLVRYEIRRSRLVSSSGLSGDALDVTYEVDITKHFFEITNADVGQQYEVTVRAVNSNGYRGERSNAQIVTVLFKDPSERTPLLVNVSRVTSKSFLISWQEPVDSIGLENYTVIVTETDTAIIQRYSCGAFNQSVMISDLKSNTLYGVQVQAYYNITPADPSFLKFVQTLQGVPASPPRSFTVYALGNSTLQLQWQSPLQTDLNGEVCKYPVVYYRLGDVNLKFKEFGARYRSGLLEHLDAWTTYNVSLAAETCGGEGGIGPHASVLQTTAEGVPEYEDLESENITASSISIKWQVKPNGNLTDLQLMITDRQSLSLQPVQRGTYTFVDLQPYTLYEIVVRVGTSQGQQITRLVIRTGEAIPAGSPRIIECKARRTDGNGQLFLTLGFFNIDSLQWRGIPQYYRLMINKTRNQTHHLLDTDLLTKIDFQLAQPLYFDSQKQSHQVQFPDNALNAIPGLYSVYMAGVNSAGEGEFSHRCLFHIPSNLTSSPSADEGSGTDTLTLVLAVVVPIVIVIIVGIAAFVLWKRLNSNRPSIGESFEMTDGRYHTGIGNVYVNDWLTEWPQYEGLQFDRSKLEIIGDLGEGEFGKVHLAVAMGIIPTEEKTKVAVKTLKGGSSKESATDFRKELEIMMEFDHPNIIKLLGVCTKEEPLYLITELMSKGDLKEFVRKARPNEVNPVAGLSLYQLLDICSQVASGMAYLASVRFVHRDVAARNCLVGGDDTELIAKVADFGMAKDVYQSDYYKKRGGILPIRWMAPEAITDGRHTVYSDIWSFGVLMWEVFSFGYQPYFGIENDRVVGGVIGGKLHLQCPPGCPAVMYALMDRCWQRKPEDRITACDLSHEMLGLVQFCKENGPDAVKQQAADRYQTLKPSKATTTVNGGREYVCMSSVKECDEERSAIDKSGHDYTPMSQSTALLSHPYQKPLQASPVVVSLGQPQSDASGDVPMVASLGQPLPDASGYVPMADASTPSEANATPIAGEEKATLQQQQQQQTKENGMMDRDMLYREGDEHLQQRTPRESYIDTAL